MDVLFLIEITIANVLLLLEPIWHRVCILLPNTTSRTRQNL